MEKQLYGLMLSMHFVDDENNSSPHSEYCVCCSYDFEKVSHYCSVLQEASDIRFKLRSSDTIVEKYRVKEISLI